MKWNNFEVILHTIIDSYRVDENRTVNLHGAARKVGISGSETKLNNFMNNNDFASNRDYNFVQRCIGIELRWK